MKKFFKLIMIILLVLIILLLIHGTKNFIIISKLQNNISKYKNSTNYHVNITNKQSDDTILKQDYYKKNNNEVLFLEFLSQDGNSKIAEYKNNEKKNVYIEYIDGKFAELDVDDELISIEIYNTLECESKFQTFLSSIFATIKSENNHYIISNFHSTSTMQPEEKIEYYIEKETGLLSKTITNNQISKIIYSFNSVSDSIFIEPDINEYTLEKSNEIPEILYSFYSADSNAINGDPIIVDVYEIDDPEFKFKYHAVWNEYDIEGTATKIEDNLYVYEYDNKKIEFKFDSFGENSLSVSEFESDGSLSSTINLFK